MKDKAVNFGALLTSSSTLICCALPALLVAVGAGATLASLVSAVPLLITISQYKMYIFIGAFTMIVFTGYVNYKTYRMPCPADPKLGAMCRRTQKQSQIIYFASTLIFICATIFTYVLPHWIY